MTQWTPLVEQSAPQPTPPPRRRMWWPWLLLAGVLAVALVIAVIFGLHAGRTPAQPAAQAPFTRTLPTPVNNTAAPSSVSHPAGNVIYAVVSDAPAVSVTYSTGGFSSQQQNMLTPPWSQVLSIPASETTGLDIIAQAAPGGTSISCALSVDGVTVSEHTAQGPSAVVVCLSAG